MDTNKPHASLPDGLHYHKTREEQMTCKLDPNTCAYTEVLGNGTAEHGMMLAMDHWERDPQLALRVSSQVVLAYPNGPSSAPPDMEAYCRCVLDMAEAYLAAGAGSADAKRGN